MNILLIDDHISFCEGLIAAANAVGSRHTFSFEIASEELKQKLEQTDNYDLYVFDLMMPAISGIDLIKHLNAANHTTPIAVMSSVEDPVVIQEVINLGSIAYIPKAYGIHQILEVLDQCESGQVHIPDAINKLLNASLRTPVRFNGVEVTRRQLQILHLMEQGLSNQAIADELFISKATVKTHINNLFKTFNVTNRVSCLRAAKSSGVNLD